MSYVYRGTQPISTDPTIRAEMSGPDAAPNPQPGNLQPCGTNAAYGRHLARGEKACSACTQAHAQYVAERRDTPPEDRRRPEASCGTASGAIRHYRRKEAVCEPCAQARREADRQRQARKNLLADAQKAYDAAMLAHPDNVTEGPRRRKELSQEVELAAAHTRAESGTPLAEAA